jgi:hypothetical protein
MPQLWEARQIRFDPNERQVNSERTVRKREKEKKGRYHPFVSRLLRSAIHTAVIVSAKFQSAGLCVKLQISRKNAFLGRRHLRFLSVPF